MGQITDVKAGNRGCDFNNLFLFESIEASTTKNPIGFAGLTAPCAGRYSKITSNWNYSLNYADDYEYIDVSPIVFNAYSSLSDEYIHTVDRFGEIISSVTSTKNCGENGSSPVAVPRQTFSNSANCLKENRTSSCEAEPEEECDVRMNPEPEPGISYSCSLGDGVSEICTTSISCENRTITCTNSFFEVGYAPEQPEAWRKGQVSSNFVQKVEDVKDWDFFFNLVKNSAGRKLSILVSNGPQNCNGATCGSGPENCWSPWAGTLVADTGEGSEGGIEFATSQKWKTRVRKVNLEDEELQKYTVIVESKYYLQIPVEDSDPIRILVDSGTDTFSGNQSRGSIHEFTNEDFQAQIGQPVFGCLNIARIDRL